MIVNAWRITKRKHARDAFTGEGAREFGGRWNNPGTAMAFHHNFDPKDERAVFVFDVFSDLLDLRVITTGIKIMLGFIGLLTLGIGGVGLMNIMSEEVDGLFSS